MAILFDLDGTLVETSTDFINTLTKLRTSLGLDNKLDSEKVIKNISKGLRKMVAVSLNLENIDPNLDKYTKEALDIYNNINTTAQPFPRIETILDLIEKHGIQWGVVTNRKENTAKPLIKHLGWEQRISCLISADTTEYAKPHPGPILEACKLLHKSPKECIYIGDDEVDVIAGLSAGITTIAITYGYGNAGTPKSPQADYTISDTNTLLVWIQQWLESTIRK